MQRMEVASWEGDTPRCCHIHISNPYSEMTRQDVGFPTQVGRYTYEYRHKCIDEHKSKIEEQTRLLEKLSFEDSLTGDETADSKPAITTKILLNFQIMKQSISGKSSKQ